MENYVVLVFVSLVVMYYFGIYDRIFIIFKKKKAPEKTESIANSFLFSRKIILDFADVLSNLKKGEIARDSSLLKNSKEEIINAFSIFIKTKRNSLSELELTNLKNMYSVIFQFTDPDTAKIVNKVHNAIIEHIKPTEIENTHTSLVRSFPSRCSETCPSW